ncbi:response regulator [Desulfonema magnum]|uniref:Two component system response regulator domain-containing protein, FAD/NAD(P)-binding domain-containing protein n=1 Tax=Desulfonema magnum TaxID=45655 RepID=A0A975BY29_9BACT|nr:response regulator [Desulfonema magnum]QTA93966.1 Two component system response regulator domain-containing protein, FAD/NAD(P)-binding domain-containing protein [Desulfonema magnum]
MKRKIGTAMVVGAGISGIRAALDLAEIGYGVTLIDREPHMGGILTQLDYQFPTDRCGMCKMLPLVDRDASSQYCLRKGLFHENIEILLSTEITSVEGEPGHFQIKLRQKPFWIVPELCIGCGLCTEVCPVEVPDEFNAGLGSRKAVYLPVPHAIPNPYVIDMAACTRCGACEERCPTGAIQLSREERKNFRILVVDDELIVRDSLKEWLEDEGFSADMAASGPEALDQLSKETYHLMLLDIKMTGMDGVEVLKQAKAASPDLCVVMMTAYATVETAVEAMKIGALDYLIKPFDPDAMIPMVTKIYENIQTSQTREVEVGAVIFAGGTAYFDPSEGKNPFGYRVYSNVVTSLEFERIMSGTGPCQGQLVRPKDGKPIRKAAWIQCVGSRSLQTDADFCSNICCMYAIKECLVAKEKTKGELDTTIFYMDMRTFGKSFQRYRDKAETEHGVCFERARVHSVIGDEATGDIILHYMDHNGELHDETFDMVILAVGQRPAAGTAELSEMLEIPLNPWGFVQTEAFSLTKTSREGILVGGAFSGLRDISESVTQASAAALSASRVIHAAGGSVTPESASDSPYRDVYREVPDILVVICTCGDRFSEYLDIGELEWQIRTDPAVSRVEFVEQTCTAQGWESLVELVEKHKPNRVLIGACLPYVYARKLRELGERTGLDPSLMEVADMGYLKLDIKNSEPEAQIQFPVSSFQFPLEMGIAKLKRAEPSPVPKIPVYQRAMVVGGGIAGMSAALAIADHGFEVDLVEQTKELGGNLLWLQRTLEGESVRPLLEDVREKVEKHPMVQVHTGTQVIASYGQVGCFYTTVEDEEGAARTLEHGVTILATGGTEAATNAYDYGSNPSVVTQKELEIKLSDKTIDPGELSSVVMIQCVDCREEPRNYCSRVCCASALKHALYLREQHPDIAIYVLYRDIMSYGFTETYFTQARKAGVIFIQYEVAEKPEIVSSGESVQVKAFDPIIGRKVEIEADLVVLATGIVPTLPKPLAAAFGACVDQDGFFQEAESKWRPVDALREGIFACGIAHSPRTVTESVATAEAAAQRSLRILSHKEVPAGKVVAKVRQSLCSLCERCIEACPYGARFLDEEAGAVTVNPVMCQGCGSCATVCPNCASVLEGFPMQQMLDVIDAALQ